MSDVWEIGISGDKGTGGGLSDAAGIERVALKRIEACSKVISNWLYSSNRNRKKIGIKELQKFFYPYFLFIYD